MNRYVFRVGGSWESTLTIEAESEHDAWGKISDACSDLSWHGVLADELRDWFEITDAEPLHLEDAEEEVAS